jgi:periplasmic protein TonB
MATLLESGAKPYGSTKGMAISMLLHGALITAAVAGTAKVVLPPREKVEEHPILYVAPPPPKPVHMVAEPLPKTEAPPKAKAPAKVYHAPPPARVQAPRPQPVAVREPTAPAITAPTKVSAVLPAVDLKIATTIGDVVAPPAPADVIGKGGISREGSVKSDGEDGGGGGSKGGLGSGSGRAYDENQVERAVQVTRKAEPRYPDALKSVGVEGVVQMHFIVGADGRVEPGSIQVISTPHKLFADAVRVSLLNTRYRPAEAGGHPVRQLVEQSFTFRLEK